MIKKWMWVTPLTVVVAGAVVGAVVGGYYANSEADPYRIYASSPIGSSNSDMIQNYFAAEVGGSRLLLLPGFSHTSPLTQSLSITSKQNKPIYDYNNKTGFVLLDDQYGFPIFNNNELSATQAQPIWSTHVAAVQFRTDLGSFITGIAAAEFLNEYQYYFAPNPNDKLTWGTYGGGCFSSVTGYMGGLQRGIRYFNDYIAPFAKTSDGKPFKPVEQVFVSRTLGNNFSNGFGPSQGDTLINFLLQKDVSMLVPVAGAQTQQAVRLINQNKSRTIVLGVDSAGENDKNSNLPLVTPGYEMVNGSKAIGGTNKVIQFSSVKRLDEASRLITNNIESGITTPNPKENGGTIGGFGYLSLGTPANGCVGLSEAGYQYFVRAMEIACLAHNNDLNSLPADTPYVPTNNGTDLSKEQIDKIFAIPDNNPENNDPTSGKPYEDTWNDLYNKYVKILMDTPTYKSLNDPKQKVYYTYNDWTPGTPPNNKDSCSYADLPNNCKQMMPINAWGTLENPKSTPDFTDLDDWYREYEAVPDSTPNAKEINATRLESLHKFIIDNKEEILTRADFNLKGVLTKEAYEKNKSIIKVMISTPDAPLLDQGFTQSAYMGMLEYWKQWGINLPDPYKKG